MITDTNGVVGRIPGTGPDVPAEIRYVSFQPGDLPHEEFDRVLSCIKPRIVQRGGVCLEPCVLTVPDGTTFYALAYHNDVEGWQRQIEGGAAALGLLSARIDGDQFVMSNGVSVPLDACKIEFRSITGPRKRRCPPTY